MSLTAAELIEVLEGLDPATEIRLATQPSWPFEYSVRPYLVTEHDLDADADGDDLAGVAWLVEGSQLRYLPGDVSRAAWR